MRRPRMCGVGRRPEWMPGRRFLVQHWEVPAPEALDRIAIFGFDSGRDIFLQHYFDSRGVARVYEISLDGGVWRLSRTSADFSPLDFSPLDFSQRFTGTFSDDGDTIEARWEISRDRSTWEHDFDLTYRR